MAPGIVIFALLLILQSYTSAQPFEGKTTNGFELTPDSWGVIDEDAVAVRQARHVGAIGGGGVVVGGVVAGGGIAAPILPTPIQTVVPVVTTVPVVTILPTYARGFGYGPYGYGGFGGYGKFRQSYRVKGFGVGGFGGRVLI